MKSSPDLLVEKVHKIIYWDLDDDQIIGAIEFISICIMNQKQ